MEASPIGGGQMNIASSFKGDHGVRNCDLNIPGWIWYENYIDKAWYKTADRSSKAKFRYLSHSIEISILKYNGHELMSSKHITNKKSIYYNWSYKLSIYSKTCSIPIV